MSIIILTSVPGAGKSTVCKQIAKVYDKIECVNFGSFLSNYLKAGNDAKYCDATFINYLTDRKNDVIVDSHGIERKSYGIKFMPFTDLRKIPLKAFVLLKSEAEKILERRTLDSKIRSVETIQEIEEHQRLLEIELITNSCQLEVPGFIIYNNGLVEETTRQLESILCEVGICAC